MIEKIKNYRRLGHRERALVDGRLITYHFYVGGITLLILGAYDVTRADPFALVALFFGVVSLVMGVGLQVFHYYMIRSPYKDSYLVTVSAALGRQRFPLLPALLGVIILFSLVVTVLYILTS